MIPFSTFLLLSMCLIATTNYHLDMYPVEDDEGREVQNIEEPFYTYMREIYLLGLGEFNLDDLSLAEWGLFILGTVLIQIMMFNLLIAILSETFARVTSEIDESDMIEINNHIIDADQLQFWNRDVKKSTYLHWAEYKKDMITNEEEENETLEMLNEQK